MLVLEAADEPGGAVRAHTVAGLRLDAGAESFATRQGTVRALPDELSLPVVSPEPVGSWVHLPSGDGPLPRTGLLGIPSHPWAPHVRRTIGVLGALRASLDLVLPRTDDPRDARAPWSAPGWAHRVLDRLVRPIVGGVHAADPDDLAVDAVAPGLSAARHRGSLARAVRSCARTRRPAPPSRGSTAACTGSSTHSSARCEAHGRRDPHGHHGRRRGCAPTTGGVSAGSAVGVGAAAGAGHPAGARAARPDGAGAPTRAPRSRSSPWCSRRPRWTAPRAAPACSSRAGLGRRRRQGPDARHRQVGVAGARGRCRHARGPPVVRPRRARPSRARRRRGAPGRVACCSASRSHAGQLLGHAVVRWTQALPRPSEAHRRGRGEQVRAAVAELPGVAVCGAWVAGNGLASVVPDAEAAARSLV